MAAYYIFAMDSILPMEHAIAEYISFIALVASLFIAASGVFVNVNVKGTPKNNVILLLIASVIANFIATTGSAMLFIRSYMRLNRGRLKAYHIVFFIFLVANVGGALTPIGDPPLFLGFLRGVPFFWTFTHVWFIWLPATAMLLFIFYVIDSRNKDESPDPLPGQKTVSLSGTKSFIWVGIIIVAVFIDPIIFDWVPDLKKLWHVPFGIREIIMLTVAFLAYITADQESMEKNQFHFEPIREVGWLFPGNLRHHATGVAADFELCLPECRLVDRHHVLLGNRSFIRHPGQRPHIPEFCCRRHGQIRAGCERPGIGYRFCQRN